MVDWAFKNLRFSNLLLFLLGVRYTDQLQDFLDGLSLRGAPGIAKLLPELVPDLKTRLGKASVRSNECSKILFVYD